MVTLNVFDKATLKVVAIINGENGESCLHAAGAADASGKQPYCSPELGWEFEKLDEKGNSLPLTIRVPREIADGEKVNPKLVYTHEDGKRYLRSLTARELRLESVPHSNLVHDERALDVPEDVVVIEAATFDPDAPVGTPGAPHRMTQAQLDEHSAQQRQQLADTAAKHGLKVSQ